eukprot:Skav232096  [mRNA]  locus=scaffold2353:89080:90360:+ [translate_table: standard]
MPAFKTTLHARGHEKLRWDKYSPTYRKRLLEGLRELEGFLSEASLTMELIVKEKSRTVDEVLEQFVRHLHSKSLPSGLRVAKHAVLAVQIMRPRLRKKLQSIWEALKSWEEQKPSSFRPPVPLPLLLTIVCRAMLFSENAETHEDAQCWRIFGALTLIGFFGLLRPGELFSLRAVDATLPNSWSMGNDFAVLRLLRPKNSRQMGVQQYVEVRHPDAVNWLAWLKSVRPPESAIWIGSPHKFRSMFRKVCYALGIAKLRLSPASLRAGGATRLVDEGFEISRIRFWGRWSHLRSLEHYVQVARAQQITLDIPDSTAQKLREFISRFSFLVHLPTFLSSSIPCGNLLTVEHLLNPDPSHVIAAARAWGRRSEAIQESHHSSWTTEGSKIHRSELGRFEKGGKKLSPRRSIQPVRKEDGQRESTRSKQL